MLARRVARVRMVSAALLFIGVGHRAYGQG
jgi:hypothetical protein